jgi:VCBS repeat-containing protein
VILGQSVSLDAAQGVLSNDTDPFPGDKLVVSAVDGQANNVGHALAGIFGTLTLNSDGSYTYATTATHQNEKLLSGGVGLDTFTYTAQDGTGNTATTTLTFVVTDPNKTYLGGTANTTINGSNYQNAVLDGSAGNDVLIAGNKNEILIGGPGDSLTAGSGHDTFIFPPSSGDNTIFGLTPKDKIDLPDLTYVPGKTSASYDPSTGNLNVTNGSQNVSLHLSGNFTNATWTVSKDATGGTIVVDPPATSPANGPPGLDHLVALFSQSIAAGFSDQNQHGALNTNPLSQIVTNQEQFLANPHHG